MNSNLTQRWLARIAMPAVVFLGFVLQAQAQCDITWPGNPNPVQFSLVIDPITGDAELNHIPVAANGVTSSMCGPLNNNKVRFYTSAAKTTFVNPGAPYHILYDCDDVGQTFTVWVAINDGTTGNMSMNPASESAAVPIQVTLIDLKMPTAGPFPANVTVNSSDDGTGDCTITDIFASTFQDIAIFGIPAPPLGQSEFTDNCLDDLNVTYQLSGATVLAETSAGPIEFAPNTYDAGLATFNVGVTTVTYRIYDNLADPMGVNPLVITVTVTVVDDEDPAITCPANQNVNTAPGICTATITNLAPAAYSDNCAVTALTWSAPGATPAASAMTGINNLTATFPLGTTIVTFTAKDAGGLTKTCMFNVNVIDNEMPSITCPDDLTVSATAPLACNYTAGFELDYLTVSDNCLSTSVSNNINGSITLDAEVFLLGTTNIIWTATDPSANTKTCSFTLTVEDDMPPAPPSPSAGQVINVSVTPGDCSATVSWEYPGLFFHNPNECTPPVELSEGPATVNGVVDPGFLFPALPAFNPFSGRMNLIFGAGATLQFPVGQTIIPYTWSDQAGNDTTEYIIVNVFEDILPTAICQASLITLPLSASGEATLTTAMVDNGSFDNCSPVTLSLSQTAFSCAHLPGTHVVTLTVTDAAMNTATCTATVDVVDNIPPQVLCPGNKTVTTNMGCQAFGVAGLEMNLVMPNTPLLPGQYSDNCSGATVAWQLSGATTGSGSGSVPSGTGFNKGVTTVTYTVTDASGNNAVCNFSVNVLDNTPPAWTGTGQAPGSTITTNANIGGCIAQVSWTDPTFTDACTPPVTVTKTHNPGAFFTFGTTTVTYTAIDGVGNVATHTFTVNVVDTQAPVAKCKDITVSLDAMGFTTVTAPQVDNLSTDNCFFSYTSPSATYNCTNLGPNSYTLQITDGSGNTGTCVSTVTVQDLIPPVASCAGVSPINLDANGSFVLNATSVNNSSTDNTYPQCALDYDISVDGSAFDASFEFECVHLGNRLLTLRVTDAAGNTATCTQIVLVKDITPPSITPPSNITVNCDESTAVANTGTFSGVSDNCDVNVAVTQLPDVFIPGGCPNSFTIVRSWKATDDSNNMTTVSHSIFVQDVEDPVFNIQNTIVIQTDDPDFCDAPLNLQLTQDSISDNCTTNFGLFDITYTIDYPTPSY
ncbi:MAG: HYR domain-containing protein, partial [Thermoanaerobaculia bacterium]|nr:HYR domain-containing protein [Thermoanaerobaculia bacterium]